MDGEGQQILARALNLSADEIALLIDQLLASLDKPDDAVDALWRREIEDRVKAYQAGHIGSVALEQVLAKYRN
ncbi:MAG: addiction module protein [Chloroflexi bacterium]|nr:addiction module protein [Chloroflexota bacterium]MCI0797287.1 addiction module protein [Chloroflexota bacterium]